MPIRVTHKVLVQVTADQTVNKKLFWLEDQPGAQVQIDAYNNQDNGVIAIPSASTTGLQQLAFGSVQQVCGVYVEVNQDATLNINGSVANGVVTGGFNVPLRRGQPTSAGLAKFFAEMQCTSLTVVVPPGTPASGLYCVWGDRVS